jgi:hypothetical protein
MAVDFIADNSPAGTDFRKLLQESYRSEPLKNFSKRNYELRQFKRIRVGSYDLSIQASATHSSMPQATLEDASKYESFEVALFRRDTNDLLDPSQEAKFQKAAWSKYWTEDGVGEYIPARAVQNIVDSFKKNSR